MLDAASSSPPSGNIYISAKGPATSAQPTLRNSGPSGAHMAMDISCHAQKVTYLLFNSVLLEPLHFICNAEVLFLLGMNGLFHGC